MPRPTADQRVAAMAALEESAASNGGRPRYHQVGARLHIHATTLQRWWDKEASARAQRQKLHLLDEPKGAPQRDPREIEPWEFALSEFGELDGLLREALASALTTQIGKLLELRRQAYETTRAEWERVSGPAKKDRDQVTQGIVRAAERMPPDMLEALVEVARQRGLA